jgi:hypothetical protein
VLAQPGVRGVHVADDDRDVLEPLVVAPAVDRDRPALRREIVDQLDLLFAEAQPDDPRAQPEHAEQALVGIALDLDLEHHLEGQHARIEGERAVHVGDRDPDRIDPGDRLRPGAAEPDQGEQDDRGQKPDRGAQTGEPAHDRHRAGRARCSPRRRPQA